MAGTGSSIVYSSFYSPPSFRSRRCTEGSWHRPSFSRYSEVHWEFSKSCGMKTGWGAVILAEIMALIAAGTVHHVFITTCFLFSACLLYEVNKISGMALSKSETKSKRH